MTALDDARRLWVNEPLVVEGYNIPYCLYCLSSKPGDTETLVAHKRDCPWLTLPGIIRALETLEGDG